MNVKEIDLVHLSSIVNLQIEYVTCLECCGMYKSPKTATCGHTLCQVCWRGRRTCPHCSRSIDRRLLKQNEPLQTLTEKVKYLKEQFEKLFNINLTEFLLDAIELKEKDPTKTVEDWLASSQNHFSAPSQTSDQPMQDQHIVEHMEISSSNIQIHSHTKKVDSPQEVVHVSIPQDDWDKIEVLPDSNDKNKENIVGPMDIEPFHFDDDEYTTNNPRRSSRKRELKENEDRNKTHELVTSEKHTSKDNSGDSDKKSSLAKQNWNNVKKMKKEFGKLNKLNKNKLNISIEMCKKNQRTAKQNKNEVKEPSMVYEIDENTPDNFNVNRKNVTEKNNHQSVEKATTNSLPKPNNVLSTNANNEKEITVETEVTKEVLLPTPTSNNVESNVSKSLKIPKIAGQPPVKMPFYKRGAFYKTDKRQNQDNETKTLNTVCHNVDTNTASNDDIEISIRVGNTITNIFIKKKNDANVVINTDREIQTSLGPHSIMSVRNSQHINTQNILINVNDNNHTVPVNSQRQEIQKIGADKSPVRCSSEKTKKNTDSADTATAHFEITESVEKELSKVMEHVESDECNSKTETVVENKHQKVEKPLSNQEDLNYLNELDIFESDSLKEANVHTLKDHTPSEIIISTVRSKHRTQKQCEKRDRENNNGDDSLPNSKKAKVENVQSVRNVNETVEPDMTNAIDSEPMNYDSIMGKVFANIDADMEKECRSLTAKNTIVRPQNDKACSQTKRDEGSKKSQSKGEDLGNLNDYNQKDSENLFSVCVDKEDLNTADEEVHEDIPVDNMEDFLTPVTHHNQVQDEAINVDDIHDDSDKSVVEETPQKTSFVKPKQRSAAKEDLQSQKGSKTIMAEKKSADSNTQSVINLTDTSLEITRCKNVTVVPGQPIKTPVNISKFVDQIKHKSTPVARKSLHFQSEDENELQQTFCPTNEVAKTTPEKEFLIKAFEKTMSSPSLRLKKTEKFCLAGSCLASSQLGKLKLLCSRNKWTYSDKFTKELTHLVVCVDDENKSQRSVKYMCALASSIWIVSFAWVEDCLRTDQVLHEGMYEALDSTGEPGPMRSRLATKKLFQGITFHCLEPFSVLDVKSLEYMLEACGGRVVHEVGEVAVSDSNSDPALLLAEPENTQEDNKYLSLAVHRQVVPVNYEWVLNSMGGYSLVSIQGLLLCPPSLLHKATERWPSELIQHDDETTEEMDE